MRRYQDIRISKLKICKRYQGKKGAKDADPYPLGSARIGGVAMG